MKKLLFAICAVAALASCSKEEVVSYDKGEAIGFANPFVNKATRAAIDPSYSGNGTLESFKVWGTANNVPIYVGNNVTESSSTWACTNPVHYWIEGTSYEFAALANAATVDLNSTNFPVKATFTAPTTADKDLIYAPNVTATGQATGHNNPVSLTFNHLLSKVKFTVKNNSTGAVGYSFEVKNITVTGSQSGTVTLGTKAWSELSTPKAAYDSFNITVPAGTGSVECAKELLLIPDNIKITFTVDIKYNGSVVNTKNYGVSPVIEQAITAGNAYNFIIGVSVGDPITFSVGYTPWDTTPGDITL